MDDNRLQSVHLTGFLDSRVDTDGFFDDDEEGVPVIGISRHRVGLDGHGINTLVAFNGCELRCKYCINKKCWEQEGRFKHYTPKSLYDEIKIDDLYFRSTGGGVTFGGGEPCLRADFIEEFRMLCGWNWKIRIETSLNVDTNLIDKLAPVVDEWIVDTKAERSVAYKEYTGVNRQRSIDNLYRLTSEGHCNIPKERVFIRVPVIHEYVSESQAKETAEMFRSHMKFPNVEVFHYTTDIAAANRPAPGYGKRLCSLLRDIRGKISLQNGLTPVTTDCTHNGECPGTCPQCEYELRNLSEELADRQEVDLDPSDEIVRRIEAFDGENEAMTDALGDLIFERDETSDDPLDTNASSKTEYRYIKKFFKECAIAGLSFHIERGDELWDELEVGTRIALVRDCNNEHDSNAVAVALADDYSGDPDDFDFDFILGYIPRSDNAELAALMDAGYASKFSAEITSYRRSGPYNDRIRITIYIESATPELVRPKGLLRAQYIATLRMQEMCDELVRRGTACFRFGGFPHYDLQFPAAGEKIVLINRDTGKYTLFLMHVLAVGDDCAAYVDDLDSFHTVDDCVPFILTNIMGPIKPADKELEFLFGLHLPSLSATDYLNPRISSGFQKIFERSLNGIELFKDSSKIV